MSDDGTMLTRPSGGHWMDPAFAQSLPDTDLIEKAWSLDRFAADCPPGAGLAGTMAEEGGLNNRNIHWRQIKSLLDDPFVQRESGNRMKQIYDVGIGLVAAMPFSFQDEKGVVLYYSRSSASVEMLRSSVNEHFMKASADLIGANFAIRKARNESFEMRKDLFRQAIRKVKRELLHEKNTLGSMVMNPEYIEKLKKQREMEAAQSKEEGGDWAQNIRVDKFAVTVAKKIFKFSSHVAKRLNNSRKKWRGAKLHGPPRQPASDSLFVFTGAFLTMVTILKMAKSINDDSRFQFDAGWYSSTLCIIFALTPAPVGQPRQIFAAHLWNILVGMACRQIPTGGYHHGDDEYTQFNDFMEWSGAPSHAEYGLPLIWVQALAVALGISGQAFIGILHPPATGLSFTFASKPQWTWSTIGSVMVADVVVVGLSMIILNLSEKKQYPLYWLGLGWSGSGGPKAFARRELRSVRRSVINAKEVSGSISQAGRNSLIGKKEKGAEAV